MKTNPKIETTIYSSNILFDDIAHFMRILKELEEQNSFKTSIYFYTKDGSTYSYRSADKLLDSNEPHNIDQLHRQETITGLSISSEGHFSFYIARNSGNVSLDYTLGSVIGAVFVDCVVRTLKLRTNSVVGYFNGRSWPILLLQTLAAVSGIFYSAEIYVLVGAMLAVFVILSSSQLTKCRIVMGTSKDQFLVRKKDDIVIAVVGLLVGFTLGLLAPFFLQLLQ